MEYVLPSAIRILFYAAAACSVYVVRVSVCNKQSECVSVGMNRTRLCSRLLLVLLLLLL